MRLLLVVSSEIEKILGAVPAFRKLLSVYSLNRGQVAVERSVFEKVDEAIAKAVWFALPFHVYVMFQIAGGVEKAPAAIIVALFSIIAVIVLGSILALFQANTNDALYETKSNQWSVIFLVAWTGTVILMTIGYIIGQQFFGRGHDLIVGLLIKFNILRAAGYPNFDPATLMVYVIYCALGVCLATALSVAIRRSTLPSPGAVAATGDPPEPPSIRKKVVTFSGVSLVLAFVLLASVAITRIS